MMLKPRASRLALMVLAMAALAALPARSEVSAGPRSFVTWIYSHYPITERHPFDLFGSAMSRVFHPSLAHLIKEDSRLAGGEVGALDGDPLCDCQDDTGTSFTIKSVRASN
ncbi:MAG TPA: hypothetical protein VGI30_05870, partial [Caulobacteraceae bacterium]